MTQYSILITRGSAGISDTNMWIMPRPRGQSPHSLWALPTSWHPWECVLTPCAPA